MADHDALERKLDLLIALTRISVTDALTKERGDLVDDPVSVALIRRSAEPTTSGALKDAVREDTGQSKATVERRMADLVSRGALIRHITGGSTTYQSSGLFDF